MPFTNGKWTFLQVLSVSVVGRYFDFSGPYVPPYTPIAPVVFFLSRQRPFPRWNFIAKTHLAWTYPPNVFPVEVVRFPSHTRWQVCPWSQLSPVDYILARL